MRTVALFFLFTLYNWQYPAGLSSWVCDDQMVALFRIFLPVGVVMVVMDALGLFARMMRRRQAQEMNDYEWMQEWVAQLMKIR